MKRKINSAIAIGTILIVVVVVAGLLWQMGRQQEARIRQTTPTSVVKSQENESITRNDGDPEFRTYRSEKYGFEVGYPKDADFDVVDYADAESLKSNSVSVSILSDIKSAVEGEELLYLSIGAMGTQYLIIVSQSYRQDINIWFVENKEDIEIVEEMPRAKISKLEHVFIDNTEAVKIEFAGNPIKDTIYYFLNNNFLYEVGYSGTATPYRQEHLDLFKKILSTFKFLD